MIKEYSLLCSFCGKSQREVKKLVAGPSVYICEECISLCNEIIEGELPQSSIEAKKPESLRPPQIKEILDSFVVGQEHAKKVLAVAVYNHYKRINSNVSTLEDVELSKSNILLIGPTGSGKTLLAQTLAKILEVPFAIADATSLTEAGYVGEDVESILTNLLNAANGDVKLAERGIVYVDEVDKITRKGDSASLTRDVSGEGVQQGLLKMMEGCICNVPARGGRKHPQQELVRLDTTNILFICGGAFFGLEDIIKSRINKKTLGFDEKPKVYRKQNFLKDLITQDLLKFGFIPEFVGRLPVLAVLDPLNEESLIRVMIEPKDALVKQYEKLFELDGVSLRFTKEALVEAAKTALTKGTGARGLRSIFEAALLNTMYDIPSNENIVEVIFNEQAILRKESPLIVMGERRGLNKFIIKNNQHQLIEQNIAKKTLR